MDVWAADGSLVLPVGKAVLDLSECRLGVPHTVRITRTRSPDPNTNSDRLGAYGSQADAASGS